jgi:membrane protein implicated in regulation of membrane protease activity
MSLPAIAAPGIPNTPDDDGRLVALLRLRTEISRMQRRRADAPLLPLDPAMAELLPDGGLRVGASYSVEPAPSLLAALLAPPTQKGIWCAVIGIPTLGVEGLAEFGVDLSRVIFVPHPGSKWLTVTSVLSEVVPLIVVRPQNRAKDSDVARLNARLRDRGCTLLVTGAWSESQATIRIEDSKWRGLHSGWGLLEERLVTVSATSRAGGTQRVHLLMPGSSGRVAPAPLPAPLPVPISISDQRAFEQRLFDQRTPEPSRAAG